MPTCLKIIHVVLGKANANRMNGVNVVAHNLCLNLKNIGVDVELWGITKTVKKETHSRPYDLKLFKANKLRFFPAPNLLKAIEDQSNTGTNLLFHLHGGWIVEFFMISLILKSRGIPFVITPHGAYNEIAFRRNLIVKSIYFKLFEATLVKNACSVHMLGKSELHGLSQLTNEFNYFFLPNGTPQVKKNRIKCVNKMLKIGYCGRINIDEKGLDLLIDGIELVNKESSRVGLYIIGDGPDMSLLTSRVSQMTNGKMVTIFGAKFASEKDAILDEIDVFVHTSRNEGMPMAVLEAASLGIPLLISKETNLGKQVKDYRCGFVLEKNGVQEIADAVHEIQRLHIDSSLEVMGKNAKQMICDEFNWSVIAKKLTKKYSEFLEL